MTEDFWIKNEDKQFFSEPDETLRHVFGNTILKFAVYEGDTETSVAFGREPNGTRLQVRLDRNIGNIDTVKKMVQNTINHFDKEKDMGMIDISKHLSSQIFELQQEAEFRNPSHLETQLVKKAGYVQGVCECVAAIGDDHTLGKKLLTEMQVTKDMARKYANPETFKALEQGIFASQQKLEQTHSIKR